MVVEIPNIIRLSLPTPYEVGTVNAYFLHGQIPALIDCGCAGSDYIGTLESELARIEASVECIQRVVLTHHHPDHAGGAVEICRRSGAELAVFRRTPELVGKDPEVEAHTAAFLERCGVPSEELMRWRQAEARIMARATIQLERCPGLRLLSGDEVIQLGDREFTLVPTPGHSLDHVCWLDRGSGVGFTGDHLLPHITPNPLLTFDSEFEFRRRPSLVEYLASLHRIEDFGLTRIYPGHGEEVDDPAALIATHRDHIRRRGQALTRNLERQGTLSVAGLARAHFGDLDPVNMYLALSETIAFLDLLRAQGRIRLESRSDAVYVHLAE